MTIDELYKKTFIEICEKANSAKEASDRLCMCMSTFRKHCKMFGVQKFSRNK